MLISTQWTGARFFSLVNLPVEEAEGNSAVCAICGEDVDLVDDDECWSLTGKHTNTLANPDEDA